jgi:hypothetical protein
MSSPEIQGYLLALRNQEEQNLEDIRLGLLATLTEYRGFPKIKQLFAEALKSVKLERDVAVGEPSSAGSSH